MNQLKVTGMLSRPCSPAGQQTALSVPHDALRILGPGRAIEPAPVAIAGNAQARRASAAKAYPGRRGIGDLPGASIRMSVVVDTAKSRRRPGRRMFRPR